MMDNHFIEIDDLESLDHFGCMAARMPPSMAIRKGVGYGSRVHPSADLGGLLLPAARLIYSRFTVAATDPRVPLVGVAAPISTTRVRASTRCT